MKQVEIYTKPWCPYCIRAKMLLKRKSIAFTEIGISGNAEKRAEMLARSDGRHTVPQIFIGGVGIGGSDELHALERAGKLDPMLAE